MPTTYHNRIRSYRPYDYVLCQQIQTTIPLLQTQVLLIDSQRPCELSISTIATILRSRNAGFYQLATYVLLLRHAISQLGDIYYWRVLPVLPLQDIVSVY